MHELVWVNQVLRRAQGEAPAQESPTEAVQQAFVANVWKLARKKAPSEAIERALNSLPLATSAKKLADSISQIEPPLSILEKVSGRVRMLRSQVTGFFTLKRVAVLAIIVLLCALPLIVQELTVRPAPPVIAVQGQVYAAESMARAGVLDAKVVIQIPGISDFAVTTNKDGVYAYEFAGNVELSGQKITVQASAPGREPQSASQVLPSLGAGRRYTVTLDVPLPPTPAVVAIEGRVYVGGAGPDVGRGIPGAAITVIIQPQGPETTLYAGNLGQYEGEIKVSGGQEGTVAVIATAPGHEPGEDARTLPDLQAGERWEIALDIPLNPIPLQMATVVVKGQVYVVGSEPRKGVPGAQITVAVPKASVEESFTTGGDGSYERDVPLAAELSGAELVVSAKADGYKTGKGTTTLPVLEPGQRHEVPLDVPLKLIVSPVVVTVKGQIYYTAKDGSRRGVSNVRVTIEIPDTGFQKSLDGLSIDDQGMFSGKFEIPAEYSEKEFVVKAEAIGFELGVPRGNLPKLEVGRQAEVGPLDVTLMPLPVAVTVHGQVLDANRVGIPNATVTVTVPSAGVTGSTTTTGSGDFTIELKVPVERAEEQVVVEAKAEGLATETISAALPTLEPGKPGEVPIGGLVLQPPGVALRIGWLATESANWAVWLNPLAAGPERGHEVVWGLVYDTLLQRDANWNLWPRVPFALEKEMATEWPFYLPEETLRWSNSSPVTVEDVQFSFEQIKTEAQWKPYTSGTVAVGGTDRFTVTFSTTSYDDNRTILGTVPLLPKSQFQGAVAAGDPKGFMGSGPFWVREVTTDNRLVLEANPAYTGPRLEVEVIEFRPYADVQGLANALAADEIDVVNTVMLDDTQLADLVVALQGSSGAPIEWREREGRLIVNLTPTSSLQGWDDQVLSAVAQAMEFTDWGPVWVYKLDAKGIQGPVEAKTVDISQRGLQIRDFWTPPAGLDPKGLTQSLLQRLNQIGLAGAVRGNFGTEALGVYTLTPTSLFGMELFTQYGLAAYRTDRWDGWFSAPGPWLYYTNPWAVRQLRRR